MALRVKNNIASIHALRQLSKNQDALTQSLERLASGQRINKAADDPTGLVISENLRNQIAGINQAVENSEVSISMVQTAEGALNQVNDLLVQVRQLALAAANEGVNDSSTLLALQTQLNNALESIDRVSTNTRFGNKTLLDGSHGISGVANSDSLIYLGATVNTRSSPVGGYSVKITQVPLQASITDEFDDDEAEDLTLSIVEGEKSVTVTGTEDETVEGFIAKLNEAIEEAHMDLEVIYNSEAETLTLQHALYGAGHTFQIESSKEGVFTKEGETLTEVNTGRDVEGTLNGEATTGIGRILVGNPGNLNTEGLAVLFTGKEAGTPGAISVSQNSLVFQIGPNAGQNVRVAIEDTSSDALARGLSNSSGFNSLAEANLLNEQGAEDTLRLADAAIHEVSNMRGVLGSFQKNALESNIANLRVTAENLISAESSIRDADIAAELADFTKNQILTQTAAFATAEANELPAMTLLDLYFND